MAVDDITLSSKKIFAVSESYAEKLGTSLSPEFAAEKLHEEVGEFAKSYLIHRGLCRSEKRLSKNASKEQLGEELADVLGWVITNAALYDIDLQSHIEQKWLKKLE